jgi:hypothetical protein
MSKANKTTFADLIAGVSPAAMKARAAELTSGFEARMIFENQMHPANMTIQAKLSKAKKQFETLGMAAYTVAAGIDPAFVNRSVSEGKRFNVYAFDKLSDVLSYIGTGGVMKNAINKAILKSLVSCEAAKEPFTGLIASAAASDKIKVPAAINKLLTRHNVGATTAPTQTSSTMNALMIAGIVINVGQGRMPIYQLTQSPAAQRVREMAA